MRGSYESWIRGVMRARVVVRDAWTAMCGTPYVVQRFWLLGKTPMSFEFRRENTKKSVALENAAATTKNLYWAL